MSRTIAQIKKDNRSIAKQRKDFLDALGELVSVTRAAKKAKVPRRTIYYWLEKSEAFKKDFDATCKIAVQALEDEAIRRAHEGTVKPVFQGGKKVGSIREYSDTLMIVLLKARDPEKYRERKELTGAGGSPLIPDSAMQPVTRLIIETSSPDVRVEAENVDTATAGTDM